MNQEKILVVDDEPRVRSVLEGFLRSQELDVISAPDGGAALELATTDDFALAIIDLNMPGISGMEAIRRLKKAKPDLEVIIFTGNPTFESSVDALHEQVFDYLTKPCEMKTLLKTARRALERRRLVMENRDLLHKLDMERQRLEQEVGAAKRAIEHRLRNSAAFLGRSAGAEEVRHQIAKVAPSNVNILLLGESGTGKEVIAQLIHESSGRDPQAFIKVNCPAIPESLIESELFGYEAGAFTGANKRKPGRFELASGGTIFLDEIGDLPFSLQSKLLQCVEQKQFYSVGGKRPIQVDVRIIAATNAPLPSMIGDGKFRADLFYRLSEYTIQIPPLRERREDILLLVDHFLAEYKRQFDCMDREISPEARSSLCNYAWPGNVRELQSLIRRFALTGEYDLLGNLHNGLHALETEPSGISRLAAGALPAHPSSQKGADDLQIIVKSLAENQWNRRKAAEKLGMSYSTLRRRISQYNLTSF